MAGACRTLADIDPVDAGLLGQLALDYLLTLGVGVIAHTEPAHPGRSQTHLTPKSSLVKTTSVKNGGIGMVNDLLHMCGCPCGWTYGHVYVHVICIGPIYM